MLNKLHDRVPNSYETYYEPFIGGGALLLNERPKKAIISDVNGQLVNI